MQLKLNRLQMIRKPPKKKLGNPKNDIVYAAGDCAICKLAIFSTNVIWSHMEGTLSDFDFNSNVCLVCVENK